jgi:hypothetical protein
LDKSSTKFWHRYIFRTCTRGCSIPIASSSDFW